MGEIGIPRREFLYEIQFWEARRIVRGYNNRDRLKHQLIAECAYNALYAMRDPKGRTVKDMFPDIFKDEREDSSDEAAPINDNEVERLRRMIREENERLQQQSHKS